MMSNPGQKVVANRTLCLGDLVIDEFVEAWPGAACSIVPVFREIYHYQRN